MKPRICKNISSLSHISVPHRIIISFSLFFPGNVQTSMHSVIDWNQDDSNLLFSPNLFKSSDKKCELWWFCRYCSNHNSLHISFQKNTYLICISMVCTILSSKGLVKSKLQTGETNWLQHLTSWLHYELTKIFYRRWNEEGRGDKPINFLWKIDMAIHNVFKQIFLKSHIILKQ